MNKLITLGTIALSIGFFSPDAVVAQTAKDLVALHGDFDRLSLDQSRSGSWVGSTSSSMLRGVLGCLRMKPARSSVSTI
jgi:hypothetical protein